MGNSERKNSRINNEDSCNECGGTDIDIGDSHFHCGDCGVPLKSLNYDTGYNYPSEVEEERRTNRISTLGSKIEIEKAHSSRQVRRLSRLQNRISVKRLDYSDKIIAEAEEAGVSGRLLLQLSDIIDKANADNKLTLSKKGMAGSRVLSGDDKSQYRRRVYAAAALEILHRDLHLSPILEILKNWNINKNDLSHAVKTINKILLCQNSSQYLNSSSDNSDNPSIVRLKQLHYHLDYFSEHLSELIDFSSAREIVNLATEVLAENGEPTALGSSDNMDGKFRNRSSQRAAMEAITYSMVILEYSDEQIKSLHKKTPISGMKWVHSRLGAYRRNSVEGL